MIRRFWLPEEDRVVDRYTRDLGRNRFKSGTAAAIACFAELERTRKSHRRGACRTYLAVQERLEDRARLLGLAWSGRRLNDEEAGLVEPYALAGIRGEYPSIRAAARACYQALPRRVRASRSLGSIRRLLIMLARRHGLRRYKRPVTEGEARVLDRYVRAVHEGRYKLVTEAAPDCLAELTRLHRKRPDARELRPRSLSWVRLALYRRSEALGLPRYHCPLTPTEKTLLEHFARKVDRGELPDWLTAARECHAEIRRRYAHPSRLRPGGPRRLTSHSIHTIHDEIRKLSRRLGLRGPRCIRWSAREQGLLEQWLRWYSRYRGIRRLSPLSQAAEGLQEDLAKMGSNRTVKGCRERLKLYYRLHRGSHPG